MKIYSTINKQQPISVHIRLTDGRKQWLQTESLFLAMQRTTQKEKMLLKAVLLGLRQDAEKTGNQLEMLQLLKQQFQTG